MNLTHSAMGESSPQQGEKVAVAAESVPRMESSPQQGEKARLVLYLF